MSVLVGTWAEVGKPLVMADGQRDYLNLHKIEAKAYRLGTVPLLSEHRGSPIGWVVGVAVVDSVVRFIAHTERTDLDGAGCSPTWGNHFGATAFLEASVVRMPNVEGARWVAGDGGVEEAASVAASLIHMDRAERAAQAQAVRKMAVSMGYEHFLDPEVRAAIKAPVLRWGSPSLVTR
jgi:hypothetical protein